MRARIHYREDCWLEFALGNCPDAERAAMQRHLDEPCEKCRSLYGFWKEIVEVGNRQRGYDAPDETLRLARAAYPVWKKENVVPQRARSARLVFDSLFDPLPAGVRSEATLPRRQVHRIGRWLIDVQLEPELGRRMALAGQVMQSGKQPSAVAGIEVILLSAGKLVTGTSANPYGEFQLQFDRMSELRIYIDIPGQLPITVLLPDDPAGPHETRLLTGQP